MWYNIFINGILRSKFHNLLSGSTLLLTYTGRKTGQVHSLPVNYIKVGDVLIITSSRQRTWWRSMRGGAMVKVRLEGVERDVFAEAVEDDAGVAAGLAQYIQANPKVAQFLNVVVDPQGKVDAESLANAARARVVVKIRWQ